LVVQKRFSEGDRGSRPRPMQIGLVIPPILGFFVSERSPARALCGTGGIFGR
jgi:hypothetical protein